MSKESRLQALEAWSDILVTHISDLQKSVRNIEFDLSNQAEKKLQFAPSNVEASPETSPDPAERHQIPGDNPVPHYGVAGQSPGGISRNYYAGELSAQYTPHLIRVAALTIALNLKDRCDRTVVGDLDGEGLCLLQNDYQHVQQLFLQIGEVDDETMAEAVALYEQITT